MSWEVGWIRRRYRWGNSHVAKATLARLAQPSVRSDVLVSGEKQGSPVAIVRKVRRRPSAWQVEAAWRVWVNPNLRVWIITPYVGICAGGVFALARRPDLRATVRLAGERIHGHVASGIRRRLRRRWAVTSQGRGRKWWRWWRRPPSRVADAIVDRVAAPRVGATDVECNPTRTRGTHRCRTVLVCRVVVAPWRSQITPDRFGREIKE